MTRRALAAEIHAAWRAQGPVLLFLADEGEAHRQAALHIPGCVGVLHAAQLIDAAGLAPRPSRWFALVGHVFVHSGNVITVVFMRSHWMAQREARRRVPGVDLVPLGTQHDLAEVHEAMMRVHLGDFSWVAMDLRGAP